MHKCIAVSQMQADTGAQIPRPDNTSHPFLPPPCNIFSLPCSLSLFLPACRSLCMSVYPPVSCNPEPISEEGSKGFLKKSRVYLMTPRSADVVILRGDYFQRRIMDQDISELILQSVMYWNKQMDRIFERNWIRY